MEQTVRWEYGEVVTRREQLGLQPSEVSTPQPATGVWLEVPVLVVEDRPDCLAVYVASGAELRFPDGSWPTPDGKHPWNYRSAWTGHGCLMVHQPPSEHYAVWHFWDGPDRDFVCWYLNIQTALVRDASGFAAQDLELDIVVYPDGSHQVKDAEVLDDRVADGRYSVELVDWIRRYGEGLLTRLDREGVWWDPGWASWAPDPAWVDLRLPE